LEALAATTSVTPARTTKPILECVCFTVEPDAAVLTAYDQEVGLRYRVPQVDVAAPGETLVRANRFFAIVRESVDDRLTFEAEEDLLHIRGADSHFQIVGQNVREFPPVPELEGEPSFAVRVEALRRAVEQTRFAAARENTRYAINGVLWEQKGKRLQLVATDGRRLALSAAPLERTSGADGVRAIVPTKALDVFGRLHLDADEVVEVRLSANQVVLRSEQVTVSSVLVEGHFPKYEEVIPREHDKSVALRTAEMLSAVRRVALLANAESKGIRLSLSSGGMVLSIRTPEQGEATVRVPVEYGGVEMDIGFNPEFIADALRVCEETATMELKDPSRPGVLTSGPSFKYVLMPVNLS
jgi:DNA polymerase-3 subunit beta